MPNPLTGYVAGLNIAYLQVGSEFNNLMNDCNTLGSQLIAEGNPASGLAAQNMAVHLLNIRNWIAWGGSSMQHFDILALDWIDTNWPSVGGVVDMNAILTALWSSVNWQTMLFVTYVDAMRGSISEKTVTEQSMGTYLRHFLYQ